MGWNGVGVVASRLSCVCVCVCVVRSALPPSQPRDFFGSYALFARTYVHMPIPTGSVREGGRERHVRAFLCRRGRTCLLSLVVPTHPFACVLPLASPPLLGRLVCWHHRPPPPHTHLSPPANLSCVSTLCFLAISLHHIFACCYVLSTPCLHVCMRACVCLCVRVVVCVCGCRGSCSCGSSMMLWTHGGTNMRLFPLLLLAQPPPTPTSVHLLLPPFPPPPVCAPSI